MKFIKMDSKEGKILKIERFKILFGKIHQILNKYSLDKNYENTFNDIKEEY